MGSSRLPGKVLREVNGRPLLSYMLERVLRAKTLDSVVVATTNRLQDEPIVKLCQDQGVITFRGNEQDVLDRYYQCGLQLGADDIVRLSADCPLIDPQVIDEVVGVYKSGKYDYVANTAPPTGTFPQGMDVEVFSFAALRQAWRDARKPSEREHVTFYFWKNPSLFSTFRYDLSRNLSRYRLTVDEPEDLEVVSGVLTELFPVNPKFTMWDIVTFLEERPGLLSRNAHVLPRQGWRRALDRDKQRESHLQRSRGESFLPQTTRKPENDVGHPVGG